MGSITKPLRCTTSLKGEHDSKNEGTLNRLNNPKKFKPTKRQAAKVLKTISEKLPGVIEDRYILVRKRVNNKTLKTYIYLVFKENTNLESICNCVHKLVPCVEIDWKCRNPSCTCHSCASEIEKGRKRRGFGYICSSDVTDIIQQLQNLGFLCEIKKLPTFECKTKAIRNPLEQFKCQTCSFIGKTKLGYISHTQTHKHETKEL